MWVCRRDLREARPQRADLAPMGRAILPLPCPHGGLEERVVVDRREQPDGSLRLVASEAVGADRARRGLLGWLRRPIGSGAGLLVTAQRRQRLRARDERDLDLAGRDRPRGVAKEPPRPVAAERRRAHGLARRDPKLGRNQRRLVGVRPAQRRDVTARVGLPQQSVPRTAVLRCEPQRLDREIDWAIVTGVAGDLGHADDHGGAGVDPVQLFTCDDPRAVNGAQALIRTLVDAGVTTSFTNPGTSEMHFVAALDSVPEMRAVLALFEGVATGAADGYARMTDTPAATLLHLGSGLGNGLANLHNARRAKVPLVNIVGDHATYHRQYDAQLQSDIETVARNVSTWVRTSQSTAELSQRRGRGDRRALTARRARSRP